MESWSDEHQQAHTLLWSAYLDLSRYDASTRRPGSAIRKRYDPLSVEEVADQILRRADGNRTAHARWPLTPSLWKLGVWTLAPQFSSKDLEGRAKELRELFHELFGTETAAHRIHSRDRNLFPPSPELRLEDAVFRTEAYRDAIHVRLEVSALHKFGRLRQIVYPELWGRCPFWSDQDHSPPKFLDSGPPIDLVFPKEETWNAIVRLPGGESAKGSKRVPLNLAFSIASSSFEARIDYEQTRGQEADEGPEDKRNAADISDMRGFLSVEKMKGRPDACRITADRTVRFAMSDFNHHLFDKETVWYWLSSEILAFGEWALADTMA